MATAASAALIGCASAPREPWKVEGTYRLEQTGASPADGYLALARQYEGEARHALALEAYRKAARAAPQDADVLNALGLALARRSQFAHAVTALRRAAALAPDRAPLLNNLGYALVLAGRTTEARAAFQEALALDSGHRLARENLAQTTPRDRTATPLQRSAEAFSISGRREVAAPRGAAPVAVEPSAHEPRIANRQASAPVQLSLLQTSPNVPSLPLMQAEPNAWLPHGEPSSAAPALAIALPPEPPAEAPRVEIPIRSTPARVEVSNGNGVTGMGAWVRGWLGARDLARQVRLTNMARFDNATTVVEYRPGFASQARAIADSMPGAVVFRSSPVELARSDVRVLLGHDMRSVIACARACPRYGEPANTVATASTPSRR